MCSLIQHIFLLESFSIPGIILGSRGKTRNKATTLREYKFYQGRNGSDKWCGKKGSMAEGIANDEGILFYVGIWEDLSD